MPRTLTIGDMDSLCHHFTERFGTRRMADNLRDVVSAHNKLLLVKSKLVTSLMNQPALGETAVDAFFKAPLSNDNSPVCNKIGSFLSVQVLDSTEMSTMDPVCVKMKTPLPGGLHRAPEIFPQVVATVMGQDKTMFHGADEFHRLLYASVYSSSSLASSTQWLQHPEDKSTITAMTSNGIELKCQTLPFGAQIASDLTCSKQHVCQSITQTHSKRPVVFTARFATHCLRVQVYPCNACSNTGLLMGTVHSSGSVHPLLSCAVVANKTLVAHPTFGVHCSDAASLLTPYARRHMHSLASVHTKNTVMRAVLGNDPTHPAVIHNLDESLRENQTLRGSLDESQLQTCAQIWSTMKRGKSVELKCTEGTVDCFRNDVNHTDIGLHSQTLLDFRFTHMDKESHVGEPLEVSVFGTYFHV